MSGSPLASPSAVTWTPTVLDPPAQALERERSEDEAAGLQSIQIGGGIERQLEEVHGAVPTVMPVTLPRPNRSS